MSGFGFCVVFIGCVDSSLHRFVYWFKPSAQVVLCCCSFNYVCFLVFLILDGAIPSGTIVTIASRRTCLIPVANGMEIMGAIGAVLVISICEARTMMFYIPAGSYF